MRTEPSPSPAVPTTLRSLQVEREQRKLSKSPAKGSLHGTPLLSLNLQSPAAAGGTHNLQEQAKKIDDFEKEWTDFKSKTASRLTFSELLDSSGVAKSRHLSRISNYHTARPISALDVVADVREADERLRVRSGS